MHIRPEQPGDVQAVSSLLRTAFAGHPHSDHTEHLIVERLRAHGRLALGLAALLPDGELVGYVAFSKVAVDGADLGWYGLGPLAVRPRTQRQGVGRALVEAGLACLRRRADARGCVVLGEPEYYRRFGFAADPALRFPGPPTDYFMALSFAGPAPTGSVAYDPAFTG
ncbi:GNAT family N-acetyltransferase [Massilia sp. KIM]|nr:GNAT family N-acetyltransferase [Massilia sp. KIM]